MTLLDRHNQGKAMPVELIILTVNIAPDLHLELPPSQILFSISNSQSSSAPVTPYPSIPSPDQYGNAATPASGGNGPASASTPTELPSHEPESDSILIDACDESWAIILSHRFNNSLHITDYRPALASGYLLRRKGISDNDGILAMSVNLTHTQRLPSAYETTLKEVLGMYRDLAALARAKGTFFVQRNTLPWHIATAVKGQEILSYVL
jgi:mediator of RNA polymerase II transcription subunit 13, fungi type